ncbi:hypothetical protein [Clostridium sp. AWRP]|nr:hypothetical protein [Clostridium sp. AWRP]
MLTKKKIKREMDEIAQAINNGIPAYEIKHAAKVKTNLLRVKLDEEL